MGEPTDALLLQRRSTERRLRKMSTEFPPAACAFRVQARVLCVGAAVVYRVVLTTSQHQDQPQQPSSACHDWVIAMSQSKLRGFYAHTRAVLQQPAVVEQRQNHDADADAAWQPFERFLQRIEGVLDEFEHLPTTAFALQARVEALYEGRAALEMFLAACWRALESVSPSLAAASLAPGAALVREVLSVYTLLRELLAFPESILEPKCVYASAVLSLEDVGELLPAAAERVCSICLERLTAAATRELNPAEQQEREENENEAESDDECVGGGSAVSAFSVRLPCAHLFHENCAMAWLRHNPSCPECRASVGKR